MDTLSFFDEMQGKIQAEDNKRRKLSKRSVYSQPELLFLQFKPEGEDLASFRKPSNSQPATSNRHKKSWHPPVKVLTQPETFEFKRSLKRGLLSTDRLVDLDKNKEKINHYFEKITRASLPKNGGGCTFAKWSEEKTPFEGSSEEVSCNNQLTKYSFEQSAENMNENFIGNKKSICSKNITPGNLFTPKCKGNFESEYNVETVINICSSPQFSKKTNTSPNTSHTSKSYDNFNVNYMKNNKEVSFASKDLEVGDQEDSYKDPYSDNILVSAYHDNDNSTDIQNRSNACNEVEMCDTSKLNLTNNINSFLETSSKNNLKVVGNRTESEFNNHNLDVNISNNYSEHEDILNSIDVILSEGEGLHDEPKTNNFTIIDGDNDEVLEEEDSRNEEVIITHKNKQITRESLDEDDFTVHEIEMMKKDIFSKSDIVLREITNVTSDRTVIAKVAEIKGEITNIISDKSFTEIDEEDAEVSKLEDNLLAPRENLVNNHLNDSNFNKRAQYEKKSMEGEKSIDGVEEEYSCLDISHSQLMEIEKEYYEAPQNTRFEKHPIPSTDVTVTCNNCGITNSNRRKIPVATQTDLIWNNISVPQQQCLMSQIPPVQWPGKMQDTRTQLRAMVQEIDRLNAILLKVRQEIWPHRNAKGASGCSTNGSSTNLWN